MLEFIDREVAGCCIEQRMRVRDVLSLHDGMHPGLCVLHNVLRFSFAPNHPGHIAAEGGEGGAEKVGMTGSLRRGGGTGW